MNSKRFLLADILIQSAVFLLLCSVVIPIFAWAAGSENIFFVYLLAVPFFMMTAIRRMFTSIFSFLSLHALLLASVYFWPVEMPVKIICACFMAVSTGYSFADRLSSENKSLTMAFLIFNAAVNIAAGIIQNSFELNIPPVYFMANILIVTLGFYLFQHLMDVAESLEAISLTSSQPVNSIKRFNNAAIMIFIVLSSAAALLSRYIPIALLLRAIGDMFIALLRFIFRGGGESPVEIPPMEMPRGEAMDMGVFGEPNDPFILWVILEYIVLFLIYAAIIAGVVGGIIYLCYKFYKAFYAKSAEHADVKEFIAPEAVYENIAARFGNMFNIFSTPPAQKIRRLFYKKVKKHMKNGLIVKNDQTARDIAFEINKKENIDELTGLYEEARY